MLKRCFASFFIAFLVFLVSVLPCFADIVEDDGIGITVSLGDRDSSVPAYNLVNIPFSGKATLYTLDGVTFTRQPLSFKTAYFAPVDHDRTMYVTFGVQNNTAGNDSWFNKVNDYNDKPTVYYTDSRDSALDSAVIRQYANGVSVANPIYQVMGDAGEIINLKITIPAYSNTFQFSTSGYVLFTTDVSPWSIVTYGGYIVDTADSSVLGVVEQILANTSSIDVNIGNLVTAVNDILAQLRSIGADTSTIVEVLGTLEDLNNRQLSQLELIANNTEAIYFFLTQALKTESDAMQEAASDATSKIENNSSAEAYYQASMQGSYDRVDLENFDLTFMDSSLELIATIFGDMWVAFGQWKIIFTFPLFLGVALLVIGRISRTGGGNSSRTSEHKGGEGGA